MNYKDIFPNQDFRFFILRMLKIIPTRVLLRFQYRIKLKRKLNLKNPDRWTEKLQVYKMKYRNPLMNICSDKYLVRDYVAKKGLQSILVDLYGSYRMPEDIDYDILPKKFIIKTTHGSGTNIICKDKDAFSRDDVSVVLRKWLKRNFYLAGREWAYKGVERKIIIEELLEDLENNFVGINDYKILCFHGQPKYVVVDVDRSVAHKRNFYDLNWNKIGVSTDYNNFDYEMPMPEKLPEMLEIARTLSNDFPFVRVDLYYINNRVYFGELTFYPWTGYVQFSPDEFDFVLGREFDFPQKGIG